MGNRGKGNKKLYDEADLRSANPEYVRFALNLSSLMDAKQIDGDTLAAALGLKSSSSISMYRTGKQFPRSPEQLIKLATALDTTVDALVGNGCEAYVQEDDLMLYAEALDISPIAISNIKSLSHGSRSASDALNVLLSHKDMVKLMRSIQEALNKADYYTRQLEDNPALPENLKDNMMELIHGKIYIASKAFNDILHDILDTVLNTPVLSAEEADHAEEE